MKTEAVLAHEAAYSVFLFRQKVKWCVMELAQWVKFSLRASLLVPDAASGTHK